MADDKPDLTNEKGIVDADQTGMHRAGPGEGWRAPINEEEGGAAQHSIYDGKGNEVVVVTTTNAEGDRKQGTGSSAEEAAKDAAETKEHIGEGFYPHPKLLGK